MHIHNSRKFLLNHIKSGSWKETDGIFKPSNQGEFNKVAVLQKCGQALKKPMKEGAVPRATNSEKQFPEPEENGYTKRATSWNCCLW